MYILLVMMNIHLVHWTSLWPTSRRAWGPKLRCVNPAWEGTTAGGKWLRSRKLLYLSEPGGALMSTVNGESAIGSVTGFAMAASKDADPLPSVEILPEERSMSLQLMTFLTG